MTTTTPSSDQYLSTCPSCQGVIDVTILEPYSKVVCPHCGEAVRVRLNFDHFALTKQIGEGGMSRVFDATDATLGRHVALKILNRHYSKDSVRMASFEREAQLTAAVTHPNVVKLYSVGKDQGNFYIAMELVSGGSLEQRIIDKGRLSELESLRAGRAIAEGLRAAYREGLIHRDVKPANILYAEDETPKIVDFGLALFHARDVDESGEIWATPFYVAPEKVREDREDFRSDMYSLGATLYHALTGRPPHKANTNSIQELKVIKSRRVRLEDSGLKFSPRTYELVNRMLALSPEDRHQSYDALVEAFRDAESLLGYTVVGRRSRRAQMTYAIVGAGVCLTLLAILLRPAPGPPEGTENVVVEVVTDPGTGAAGQTVAAGAESVAEKFLRARGILLDGDYGKARRLFDELILSNLAKQPTLNWARFNAALCAIVGGRKEDAAKYFRDIYQDAAGGVAVNGNESLKEFFAQLGMVMGDNVGLKVAASDLMYDANSEEVMGYLVHGLAQWHFGQPVLARDMLTLFNDSMPGRGLEWVGSYKKLIAPYLQDMEFALKYGEPKVDAYSTVLEARLDLDESKSALAKLKTQGVLRAHLNQRIRFDQSEITRLKQMNEETERLRLAELRGREQLQFADLLDGLPALARGYDVTPTVELLEGIRFETPEVQSAMKSKLYLWSKMREFMQTLMEDVLAKGYDGAIARKSGLPLNGRVTALGYTSATIKLERGQYLLPTEELKPETLIAMAQFFVQGVTDSTDYYRRQELIAVFAKMQGLDQTATTVAGQLMEENRDFRQRWALAEQSGF